MPRSTPVYGLDTSVFVRLLTGHPVVEFEATSQALEALFGREPGVELVVSNQVIGEAYITLQHHYQLSKSQARNGILKLLRSGMVFAQNGAEVMELLEAKDGAGLMDRLIVQDYRAKGATVLTNDRKMAILESTEWLVGLTEGRRGRVRKPRG